MALRFFKQRDLTEIHLRVLDVALGNFEAWYEPDPKRRAALEKAAEEMCEALKEIK
jgi:hypothetical protein